MHRADGQDGEEDYQVYPRRCPWRYDGGFSVGQGAAGKHHVTFASPEIAERLAGSVAGTILPFSFNQESELVVDPSLLENDEMYFNAARLDRSMVLSTRDYVVVAKPRFGHIARGR